MVRETDRKEIRRYLGYYGKKADETIEGQISICLEEMCLAAEPKAVFRRCGLICREDGRILITALPEDRVRGTLMEVTSKSLAKNLHGCCGVYLMAVTLGPGGPEGRNRKSRKDGHLPGRGSGYDRSLVR